MVTMRTIIHNKEKYLRQIDLERMYLDGLRTINADNYQSDYQRGFLDCLNGLLDGLASLRITHDNLE